MPAATVARRMPRNPSLESVGRLASNICQCSGSSSVRYSKCSHHKIHWTTEISALLYALGNPPSLPGIVGVLIDLDFLLCQRGIFVRSLMEARPVDTIRIGARYSRYSYVLARGYSGVNSRGSTAGILIPSSLGAKWLARTRHDETPVKLETLLWDTSRHSPGSSEGAGAWQAIGQKLLETIVPFETLSKTADESLDLLSPRR